MNEINQFINFLEAEWDIHGFLYEIRCGEFDNNKAIKFAAEISKFKISEEENIPKRLISLIWYLPIFLLWQRDRIAINNENIALYDNFSTTIINALKNIFGFP